MFKKLIIASAILAASSSVALAATTGPYVGASIGVNSSTFNLKNTTAGAPSNKVDLGGRGAIANLFAGYGQLVNQNVYLGGEAFVDATNTQSKTTAGTASFTINQRYGYGISFIPGLMLSNDTMAYARVGLVRSNFQLKASAPGASTSKTQSLTGGQFGVGLQTSLTQNVDLRGEYDYTTYGSKKITSTAGTSAKFQPRTDAFTVGLVYKFD